MRCSLLVTLVAIVALATVVSAQWKPHKPSGIPDQSRPWPINWCASPSLSRCAMCCCLLTPRHLARRTLQARVREECTGTNRNGTERFFTLFYNSLTNQFRADVTYGVGINTYTQYFNYVRAGVRACLLARLLANKLTSCSFGYAAAQNNGTGAIFFNASPSGAAHCELVKPGSANTNSFLLPRNWYRSLPPSLPPSRSCSPARVLGLPNTASLSTSRYWRRTGLPPQSGPARRRLTASA